MHKHLARALPRGLAVLLLLGAAGVASADPAGYAGLGVGNVTYGFDSTSCESETGAPCSTDTGSTGFKFFAGVDVNRNVGLEAAYENLGTLKGTVASIYGPINIHEDFTAFTGDVMLKVPLNPSFDLGIGFGFYGVNANATADLSNTSASSGGSTTGLHLAAYADANFNSRVGARIEFEDLTQGGENKTDIDLLSLGLIVRF